MLGLRFGPLSGTPEATGGLVYLLRDSLDSTGVS